jgi:hypothetical protein
VGFIPSTKSHVENFAIKKVGCGAAKSGTRVKVDEKIN